LAVLDEEGKTAKVLMSRRLKTQLEIYDDNHLSALIMPPEIILHSQVVFFDHKFKQLTSKNHLNPFLNSVCYYTLLVAAAAGGSFSNKMLVDSKLCPPTYEVSRTDKFDL
jgi:hypothetical protein